VVAAVVLAALAGCSSSPSRDRAAVERPPELLYVGDLRLPQDCAPVPGAVYRAEYVVGEGGGVEGVVSSDGPPCVQAALSQWVRTFRYAPGSAPASSVIDWMITVAQR
jgi:hypothetical protein